MKTFKVGDTRRVIELQSDLFQKGRLENELKGSSKRTLEDVAYWEGEGRLPEHLESLERQEQLIRGAKKQASEQAVRESDIAKLESYRNTWHERVIREEVKQAAIDGKTKLQFPTGETAMKIEGLGQGTQWNEVRPGRYGTAADLTHELKPESMKVGKEIQRFGEADTGNWIITDILGDGKFKAVPRNAFTKDKGNVIERVTGWTRMEGGWYMASRQETFDISGKVDAENPIYRFYEKEVGRYLKNKYGAEMITDAQGVNWWQLNVPGQARNLPIEAFAAAPLLMNNDNQKDDNLIVNGRLPFQMAPNNQLFLRNNHANQ